MSQTQLAHRPCPDWCTTPHANLVKFEAPPVCSRIHTCVVAEVPNPGRSVDGTVKVSVLVHDDTETGEREGPAVDVQHAECMTPATATEVAASITEAVRIATS